MSPGFDLTLDQREHYLFARVDGPEDTYEVSVAYWTRLRAECEARGTRRLLVLEALEGNAVPGEAREVVEALVRMGFHDIRIAYVDATEDAALLVSSEIRVVRAGVRARVFRGVEEAESWLLEASADPSGAA
ncbi:MAG TPA: hypothetical protein VIG88_10165 [Lysobacter sp.]